MFDKVERVGDSRRSTKVRYIEVDEVEFDFDFVDFVNVKFDFYYYNEIVHVVQQNSKKEEKKLKINNNQ